MDFAYIRSIRDAIWINSMAKKLSSSLPTSTTLPGTRPSSTKQTKKTKVTTTRYLLNLINFEDDLALRSEKELTLVGQ